MKKWVLPLAGVVLLVGCGGSGSKTSVKSCDIEIVDPVRTKDITPLKLGRRYTIEFQTTQGNFTVEIDPKRAPCNGDSMLQLVEDGFFNGIRLHRIIPGFVIQGGRSTKTPDGGPGYATIDPPPPDTRYMKGDVAMAKRETDPPGTGSSEFFIVTGDSITLTPDYATLGKIVKGMKVVERIGRLGNPATEEPTEKIVIKRATASGL